MEKNEFHGALEPVMETTEPKDKTESIEQASEKPAVAVSQGPAQPQAVTEAHLAEPLFDSKALDAAPRLLVQIRPANGRRADSTIVFGLGSVVALWGFTAYWIWSGISGLFEMDIVWATLWLIGSGVMICATLRQTLISSIHYLVNKNWNSKNYSAIDMVCTRSFGLVSRLPLTGPCDMAYLESSLAGARMRQGFCESAEELLKTSIAKTKDEIERANVDIKPQYKPFLGSLIINQAVVCVKLNKYAEAERLCLEAQELFENESRPEYRIYKVLPSMTHAWICLRWNEIEKADEYMNEAAAEYENLMKDTQGSNEYMEQTQSSILLGMALIRAKRGRVEESTNLFLSFKLFVKATKSDICTHNLEWLSQLSEAYVEVGKYLEAEEAIELAYVAARELGFHPESTMVLNAFEKVLGATERAAEVPDMRLWLRPSAQEQALIG